MTARHLRQLGLLAGLLASQLPYSSRQITAQGSVTEGDLDRASGARVVNVGTLSSGQVAAVPLETYVARVIAGEAEPGAPEAAQQALAIAIRTFAIVNLRRHARDGFDLCDSTHCQVPRASTAVTRQAALATAGRILVYDGVPAAVFYSANCGGRSEVASEVWPGISHPYLQSIPDDVHADDVPWTLTLTRTQIRDALVKAGFTGRELTSLSIDSRNSSGRVSRVRLTGLQPDIAAGDAFRMAIGARELRSTAFSIETGADTVRFTGRGYGHGVGMCVVGAARRARRGESAEAILNVYYPGVRLVALEGAGPTATGRPESRFSPPVAEVRPPAPDMPRGLTVRVPADSLLMHQADLELRAARAMGAVTSVLRLPPAPVTIEWHDSLQRFSTATGRPWWVGAASSPGRIDLSPSLVTDGAGAVDEALRTALAETLMSPALEGRPLWVRVGGARYLSHTGSRVGNSERPATCPSDRELLLAASEREQRAAAARAEQCFAYAYAKTQDWRTVK